MMSDRKFKKGDVVTLSGVVKWDQDKTESSSVFVQFQGVYDVVGCQPDLLKFEYSTFAVGDHVWSGEHEVSGIVLAVNGDKAWVQCGWNYMTIELRHLELADQPTAEAAE